MDDGVAGLGAALQACEVLEVALVGVGAGFGEGGDRSGASGETEDLVAVFEQFADGGLADEAGGSGDEDAHGWGWEGGFDEMLKLNSLIAFGEWVFIKRPKEG